MCDCEFVVDPRGFSSVRRLACMRIEAPMTGFQCCTTWQDLRILVLSGNEHNCMPENLSTLPGLSQLCVTQQLNYNFQIMAPLDFIMPHLCILHVYQAHDHQWSLMSQCFLEAAKAHICSNGIEMGFRY